MIRRFWNWLCSPFSGWWKKERAHLVSQRIDEQVAREIKEQDEPGRSLDEQIEAELAKPEIASKLLVSPKKRRQMQHDLPDPDVGGPGMVRGHDGVWRAVGNTPFEVLRPFVGSEDEEIQAARPKPVREQPKRPPKGHTTCCNCFGWGFVGRNACQGCDGKGYVRRS